MKKIAIVGSGISGLYFANLLQKNAKYDYKIFEKKPQADLSDGYGIQLSVNSIKLLKEIDFNNIDKQNIFNPKKINFIDAANKKKICDIDISKFNFDNNFYTTLKRSELIKFLLKKIPLEKILYNVEINRVNYSDKIKINFSNNITEEFDYLVICDGIFSKTKSIILEKESNLKYFNSIALRGSLKNFNYEDICLFLGKNFHFVIYPVNKNREFNFVSIIRKKLTNKELYDENLFKNNFFLDSLKKEIFNKTSLNLSGEIKNIKSFPIFVSKKINVPLNKNTYLIGDALFAFPPSFAQGASQSIESSKELYEEIISNKNVYYKRRLVRIKLVNRRSKLNHFIFHLSNPITIFIRNIILKYLVKNSNFLETYLGKIYKS